MIDHSILMQSLHIGFVDLIVAGVGLAMSGAGLFGSQKAAKKQQAISRQANQTESSIATLQQQAADVQFQASEQISGITQQQEELRKTLMLNTSARQARQIARETQIARSTALATAENQGALTSSGLQGALGSISQQGAEQGTTLFNNTQLGLQNFELNRGIFDIQSATNRRVSEIGRQVAPLQTRLRTLGVQSSNTQARQQFNNTLFQTGLQIAGSAGKTADVFDSLFGGKRTGTG